MAPALRACRRVACLLLVAATPVAAGEDARGRLLDPAAYRPATTALSAADRDFLGYGTSELPRAQLLDINGDGIPERFVIGHDRLCGGAGCPLLLLEGRSGHRIGEFVGAVAVLQRRVAGHAVLQLVSRRDPATTEIETRAFDGASYRRVGHALLRGEAGLRAWRNALDPPPKR